MKFVEEEKHQDRETYLTEKDFRAAVKALTEKDFRAAVKCMF